MTFSGHFKTYDNQYTYYIQIGPDDPNARPIRDPLEAAVYNPAEGTIVMFDPEPVTLNVDRQDLQKRIIISQATINLLSNENLTTILFADTNRSIPVHITRDNQTVFFGYVDPLQFNQGYAHHWETVQISATDPLGKLEDVKVNQLNGVTSSTLITPAALLTKIFEAIDIPNININSFTGDINGSVLGSMTSTNINMGVFWDEAEDDLPTLYDVLEEICKYFNLYVAYYNHTVNITCTINYTPSQVTITNFKDKAYDDSTALSTDDAYSRVYLTCNIEPRDETIVALNDNDYLRSDYNYQQKYMTEVISEGNGTDAYTGFYDMVVNGGTTYDSAYSYQNYCYVKRNDAWDFGPNSYITLMCTDSLHPNVMTGDQRKVLKYLKDNSCKGALIAFGKSDKISRNISDDGSNASLTDYLVISINGNCNDFSAGGNAMKTKIESGMPICSYKGLTSDILSPTDDTIINYIVLSGNILLNPLQPLTGSKWRGGSDGRNPVEYSWSEYYNTTTNTWNEVHNIFGNGLLGAAVSSISKHTVYYSDNERGDYYQQFWHDDEHPEYSPANWQSGPMGIYGNLSNNKNKAYQYLGTKVNDASISDTISKLPILACQLRVINYDDPNPESTAKYCVEMLNEGKDGVGKFKWLTLSQISAINPALKPYFTIGFDIGIDQYVIGQSYPIQDNGNYKNNIDLTGTAIPINKSDELIGTIEFKIMGPYNVVWKEGYTTPMYVFPDYYYNYDHVVMQHIQSILLSNFKISVTSNNGMISKAKNQADNDLVYYSDVNTTYIEKMEDEIKICTPLTPEELIEKDIIYKISNSYIYKTDNTPFYGYYWNERGIYIKPEECLVDYYYKEYSTPAKMLDTCMKSTSFGLGMNGTQLTQEMMKNSFVGIYPSDNTPYRIMKYEQSLKHAATNITFRQYKTYNNQQLP